VLSAVKRRNGTTIRLNREPEKAVLVGVILPTTTIEDPPLAELAGLADAAGVNVVGQVTQRRLAPDAATFIGRGKLEDVKKLVRSLRADLVIFDNDLSPAQGRNIEREVGARVLDRTQLILDIFARRAQTYEAQLAVELAQLEYTLPRLKRMWTHLERQTKGGVGLRGPGEKQLEMDRRLIAHRIHELRSELEVIHRRRQREVIARKQFKTVSLVGYTNAGKSTLMNSLTHADVYVEDALFATLDTRTRRWQLPGWGPVLLSDTVGFIRDLPHHLIASFKATLEEARQADLLLHVADGSNPAVLQQISAAYRVLEEIGIEGKDTILVINKIDRIADRRRVDALLDRYPQALPISAQTGEGLAQLTQMVSELLARKFIEVDVETTVDNARVAVFVKTHGEVFSQRYHHENRLTIRCRLPEEYLPRIERLGASVRRTRHNGSGQEQNPAPEIEQSRIELEPTGVIPGEDHT
jgi:GTP-binding protein HflX